jgi:hypothetical protein
MLFMVRDQEENSSSQISVSGEPCQAAPGDMGQTAASLPSSGSSCDMAAAAGDLQKAGAYAAIDAKGLEEGGTHSTAGILNLGEHKCC